MLFDRARKCLRARFRATDLELLFRGGASAFLRGMGLIAKFVLSWVVARRFGPMELGMYGLMVIGIGLASNAASFEISYFTTRELLASRPWRGDVLRRQAQFHSLAYLFVLPASALLFLGGFLPWTMVLWFLAILISEQVAMETYRLLVILEMQVLANIMFFVKSGGWILVLLPIFWLSPRITMAWIWSGWLGGNVAAILLGLAFSQRTAWTWAPDPEPFLAWLRRALKVALPYWMASILARLGMSMDRLFLQKMAGTAQVGIYTFFMNNNTAIITFVDGAVVAYFLPRMVKVGNSGDPDLIREEERRLIWALASIFAFMAVVSGVAIKPLLYLLGRPIYLQNLAIHWILLASVGLSVLGFFPQLRLYRQKRDRATFWSNLMGIGIGAGLNLALVPRYQARGAAMANLGTSITWLATKIYFSW